MKLAHDIQGSPHGRGNQVPWKTSRRTYLSKFANYQDKTTTEDISPEEHDLANILYSRPCRPFPFTVENASSVFQSCHLGIVLCTLYNHSIARISCFIQDPDNYTTSEAISAYTLHTMGWSPTISASISNPVEKFIYDYFPLLFLCALFYWFSMVFTGVTLFFIMPVTRNKWLQRLKGSVAILLGIIWPVCALPLGIYLTLTSSWGSACFGQDRDLPGRSEHSPRPLPAHARVSVSRRQKWDTFFRRNKAEPSCSISDAERGQGSAANDDDDVLFVVPPPIPAHLALPPAYSY